MPLIQRTDHPADRLNLIVVLGLIGLAVLVLGTEAVRGGLTPSDIPKLVSVGLLGYLSNSRERKPPEPPVLTDGQ
jgi:hypothetical protein